VIVKVIVDKSLQIGFSETPWVNEIDFTHATGTITERLFNFWYKEPKKYSTILLTELLGNIDHNDTNAIYELSDIDWHLLKDHHKEKFVKDRNILISNSNEAFLYGLQFTSSYHLQERTTIDVNNDFFNMSELASKFIVVWDNFDTTWNKKYPHINFVRTDSFLLEAIAHVDNVTDRWIKDVNGTVTNTSKTKGGSFRDYAPWIEKIYNFRVGYEQFIEKNLSNINDKKHDFVCLFGFQKPHREDLWNKMQVENMQEFNIVGSYDKRFQNALYEPTDTNTFVRNSKVITNDRSIAYEWITDAKVWIANETWWEGSNAGLKHITEKTYKPIQYGLPFIVNGSYGSLEFLEELGFKSYRDIFGDYIVEDDFIKTNKNIINILKDMNNIIDRNEKYLRACALHNWRRLLQMSIEQRLNSVEAQIWN